MKLNEWIDFARAMVRPFITVWGFIIYSICVIKGIEVPPVLSGLVTATIAGYFGERAILRLKRK
ncbi:MAG: hypothetical protein HYX84_05095 [Chloroflexi bacterium]|nr:hypothetical protein [Chloroflexota bacterium]